MTNLFTVLTTGTRGSNKTAELTTVAEKITSTVFNNIGNSLYSLEKEIKVLTAERLAITDADSLEHTEKSVLLNSKQAELDKLYTAVEDSKVSHDAMDKLIASYYELEAVDLTFIKFIGTIADDADESTIADYEAKKLENDTMIDKMIKSQQSKRSRSKSKAMTHDNYTTLMVGAVAENLLRIASGKEKASVGHSGNTKQISYDQATIDIYTADKDKLNKEIRNIQSKKSIMKSKAGFDTQSESWITLLEAEAMLKSLRGDAAVATITKEVVPEYVQPLVDAKKFIDEKLVNIDINKMKSAEAKDILMQIAAMMMLVEVPADEAAADNDAQ